ncbi:MAG: helix-turn-helix domain-containing protein [Pseudomonadota bacterium]
MLFLDALIRFSAIALMAVFVVFAIRDAWSVRAARWGVFMCISLAAMLATTVPDAMKLPDWTYVPLRLIDMVNIVLVWIFGRALFDDDFRAGWLEWGALAVYAVSTLPMRLKDFGVHDERLFWLDVFQDTVSFAMFANLVYIALRGRADDLVEPRRRARLIFALLMALGAVVAIVAENLFSASHEPLVSMARSLIILLITCWGLFWLMRLHPEILRFEPAAVAVPTPVVGIDPRDALVHGRLVEIMTGGAYAESGLTIGGLAGRLSVPEHQLRALINQGLGFRNFSAFLNSYRIEAAKAALADPEQARTPVLTIAMDTGFGSLAPFNRAFKASEGVTPSQFRKTAIGTPIDPEKD